LSFELHHFGSQGCGLFDIGDATGEWILAHPHLPIEFHETPRLNIKAGDFPSTLGQIERQLPAQPTPGTCDQSHAWNDTSAKHRFSSAKKSLFSLERAA